MLLPFYHPLPLSLIFSDFSLSLHTWSCPCATHSFLIFTSLFSLFDSPSLTLPSPRPPSAFISSFSALSLSLSHSLSLTLSHSLSHLSFSSPMPQTLILLMGWMVVGEPDSDSTHCSSIPWITRNTGRPWHDRQIEEREKKRGVSCLYSKHKELKPNAKSARLMYRCPQQTHIICCSLMPLLANFSSLLSANKGFYHLQQLQQQVAVLQ